MTKPKEVDFTKPIESRKEVPMVMINAIFRGEKSRAAYIGIETEPTFFYPDGRYYRDCNSDLDIVNVPEKIVSYINVYPASNIYGYLTRKNADDDAFLSRIACIRIEYTAGQYDD